jgi:uncharacterized protein with NRDE domain
MCFTLFKIGAPSDDYKLILGFNRDELFHRPTGPAAFWTVDPRILAATDLDPKNPPWGTWLGASTTGKIGFITNYTVAPEMVLAHAPTRGTLVTSFLRGDASPQAYTASISSQELLAFNGFNLVVIDAFSDEVSASYLGNREHKPHKSLGPGCYCLSNRTLDDASWPKVEVCLFLFLPILSLTFLKFGKQSFESFVATPRPRADLAQGLFDILHDGTRFVECPSHFLFEYDSDMGLSAFRSLARP